jgi:soluble lytic murein transglycosylase
MVRLSHRIVRYLTLATALASGLGGAAQAQFVTLADPITTGAVTPQIPLPVSGSDRFPELTALKSAAELYRKGDTAGGDTAAAKITDAGTRVAAEWIAIRTAGRSLGFERISRFLAANPDIPMQRWLQRKAEDALIIERSRADRVIAFFANRQPESVNGRAALAVARSAKGDSAAAERLALEAYRDRAITRDVAEFLEKSFPALVTSAEKALRAHRLIINDNSSEGLRIAAGLGPDQLKLAQALASAQGKGQSLKALDDVPPALRSHSSFRLASAQIQRRLKKHDEALTAMVKAPRDASLLADPDEWWTERRALVRRLLDAGDPAGAYRVAAEHAATSVGRRAEAEFHAGWIALRYLSYPQTALIHFDESAKLAELTAARSRAAYWRGRALEAGALGESTSAEAYHAAANYPSTYYGQLAAA